MTAELRPDVRPDAWRGAAGWDERDGALRAWRLRPELVGRAFSPELLSKAREAAGVRLDVLTDADTFTLEGELRVDLDRDHRVDVLVDGELHQRIDLEHGAVSLSVPLPQGEHRVQAWLPQVGQLWLRSAQLTGSVRAPAAGTRWTTYGSSITQCSAAAGPSETWPALVARALDWDLTCLGFGGQCHLDPVAARTIAATSADLISLCLGINVQGGATMSQRTFGPQVAGLIDQVRDAHPGVPIAVMTPIVSPPRESTPNAAGVTLAWMREAITEVVEGTDDENLHLIDGPSIIGVDDQHLLPDELHPDAAGYRLMGERMSAALAPLLG
ncbi:GDSL-type esterase/lipase family protein [Pseudactinotalea sp.]|uniref:GDSL-type esterase/lipase family protein n=1 Tax=Pseudactinotalea sp. TaxID=1926260 RepID=UPI003B3A4F90